MIQAVTMLFIHFVADFIAQTRTMGLNKGKSIKWLSIHVCAYLAVLMFVGIPLGYIFVSHDIWLLVKYCLFNAALHWITDFITSRASGYCYLQMNTMKFRKDDFIAHVRIQKNRMKDRRDDILVETLESSVKHFEKKEYMWQYHFWSVIGFDQFIHAACLLLTFQKFFIK